MDASWANAIGAKLVGFILVLAIIAACAGMAFGWLLSYAFG